MKRFFLIAQCSLAAALGVLAAGVILTAGDFFLLTLGIAIHLAAVRLCLAAARSRRGDKLLSAETDAVVMTALFLPVVGPGLGWCIPRRQGRVQVENAHEAVVRYMEHVKPSIPEYERSLFTGDFERDLARKLDMESYREVLRHGQTDQKRNALGRLADLGEPHHLALIRGCLEDEDQEVRLYAYGELDRLVRGYEDQVRKARALVKEDANDPEAHRALALAHFELALSGVLDPRTGAFHLRGAARSAERGRELDPKDPAHSLLLARIHAYLGDFDAAHAFLDDLGPVQNEQVEACRVRALVAYMGRDFDLAREQAGRLMLAEEEMPDWLAALCVADEQADGGQAAPPEDSGGSTGEGPETTEPTETAEPAETTEAPR